MEKSEKKPWSPYLCGALTGVLMVLSVWVAGKYFGASTTFARNAAAIEKTLSPEHVTNLEYFKKYAPKIDWQMLFVIGILTGAFISSITSRSFRIQLTPDSWRKRFGSSALKRGIVAFIGGIIAAFGARFAGGCPSGHGLSGLAQLSASGYIALVCFFVGGLVMAKIVYSGRAKS